MPKIDIMDLGKSRVLGQTRFKIMPQKMPSKLKATIFVVLELLILFGIFYFLRTAY